MEKMRWRGTDVPILQVALVLALTCEWVVQGQQPLSVTFYNTTCPNVDSIVTSVVTKLASSSNVVAPSTLRLFTHDCFVQGCDGSILVASTGTNAAESSAADNLNLPGQAFDAVFEAKKAVEAQCPGVVSCSDILAMAARDAVTLMGGPRWEVPKGRRDGLVSQAALVPGKLPGSNLNVSQLTQSFAAVNLSQEDMVVLSGAHTIGFSHCDQFSKRLYTYNTTNPTDPSIETNYATHLKSACPQAVSQAEQGHVEAFDLTTPFAFDNAYYRNLQVGKGLLVTDQVLFEDPSTRALVDALAASQDLFFQRFTQSMIQMSLAGVKTGLQGEIRRDCTRVN